MVTAIGPEVTNGAASSIGFEEPYMVDVRLCGASDLLFHRWNCESVEAKSKASKGSKAKKTDDVESYIYRNAKDEICLPGEMLRQATIHAAKFRQDPRSPRKSAMDLFKAAIVPITTLAPIMRNGSCVKAWEYDHRCRVVIQRNSITRVRPAIREGWEADIRLLCTLPEYISASMLHEVINAAGRLCGVGTFRPTYGRFNVVRFDVVR